MTLLVVVAVLLHGVVGPTVVVDAAAEVSSGPVDPLVGKVLAAMQAEQVQRSLPFQPFPLQWRVDQGLYRSEIHLNFVGQGWWEDESNTLLRRNFAIPDSNMFVTTFILSALLEAASLDAIELAPDDQSFHLALDAVLSFKDKNRPAGVPVYSFWPQEKINGTWAANPVNLVAPSQYYDSLTEFVAEIFKSVGLEGFYEEIEFAAVVLEGYIKAYHIPADLDDSSVNMALGGMLAAQRDKFPQAYAKWEAVNSNVTGLFELINKYAYRPFVSNGQFTDLIDPRSYYFMHPFLAQLSQPSLALGCTWLMDLVGDNKTSGVVGMPFHVNNVDMTVISNFLYGTSQAVLEELNGGAAKQYFISHPDFQQVYENSAQAISWAIETGAAAARPDISLLYYPSIYDFLWMAARTARYLNAKGSATNAIPTLARAKDRLTAALKDAGTQQILASAHYDSVGAYWDDFLGDYGQVERGEDRLFSTALATNMLIDVWSVPSTNGSGCKLQWARDVPETIAPLVSGGIAYLRRYLLSGEFELGNAFFSGSMKGDTTAPWSYPATYSHLRNGTALDPITGALPDDAQDWFNLVYGMKGVVPDSTYRKMTDLKWWGNSTPKQFLGFNAPGSAWPYWSSPAMTYAMSLIALANFQALQQCPIS